MTASFVLDTCLLGLGMPQGYEWIILLVLGLLIFGKRLPEVGRSLGRGIIEFKKGIKGIDAEIEEESSRGKEPARVSPPPRQELPRSSPPAEPRVSRGSTSAEARPSADDAAQVEAGSGSGSDSDRD